MTNKQLIKFKLHIQNTYVRQLVPLFTGFSPAYNLRGRSNSKISLLAPVYPATQIPGIQNEKQSLELNGFSTLMIQHFRKFREDLLLSPVHSITFVGCSS